jgi:hypothetical protein
MKRIFATGFTKVFSMRKRLFLLVLFFSALCSHRVLAMPRVSTSLSGTWQYVKVKSLEENLPQEGWQNLEVPGQIGGFRYERAWFRRNFDVPANWQGRKIWLRFGGLKWDSRVFVNGQNAGGELNGYNAFDLDISKFVKFGQSNELRIGVRDWTATFAPGKEFDLSNVDGFAARNVPKDAVVAPFGGHNANFGIWDDVDLEATAPVYVSEFFVRPNVVQKKIEIDVTVKNDGTTPFSSTHIARILNTSGGRDQNGQWKFGNEVAKFAPQNVTVAPGGETKFTLVLNNPPLKEWTPQSPNLYILELGFADQSADTIRERIGYRQMETRGGDFVFNGKKTHLLATSWWPRADAPHSRDEVSTQLRAIKAANTHVFRTHTQPWPRRWYELADEIGVMMIPEGAMWCDSSVYAVEDERFWQNYGEHLTAMVKHLRNHASIVMYSLENEMGHCGGKTNPAMEAGMARMGRLVKSVDPTKPITFEADGDPGSTPTQSGAADVLGLHYPNEYPDKRLWPNDAYWMNEPRQLSMWWKGGQPFLWDRKKPLYIGEYLWVYQNSSPAAHTIFFGDEAYKDHWTYSAKAKSIAWRMQILAYRHYGVSGQSPWTMQENGPLNETNPTWLAHRDMYRPLAAFLRDYDSRFYSGTTVSRRVELFNDTLQDEPQAKFQWTLLDGTKTLARGEQTVALMAGDHKETTFNVDTKSDKLFTQATLRLTLSTRNGEQFRQDYPVQIQRQPVLYRPKNPTYLFDPQGDLKKVWTGKTLNKIEDWNGDGVLVIGPEIGAAASVKGSGEQSLQPLAQGAQNATKTETNNTPQVIGATGNLRAWLEEKVQRGGRVLVLEQGQKANDWLPVPLTDQGSTMTFAQTPSHPALLALTGDDLKFWRGDHLVSHHEPARPANGGAKAIIVSGSGQGISHAPLLEIPSGRGAWMICQMRVVSKLNSEPAAQKLLSGVLRYLDEYSQESGATYFAGSADLGAKLQALGVKYQNLRNWNDLKFPQVQLLIVGDGGALAQNAAQVQSFVNAGGQVLWHRPSAANFASAQKALKLPVEMQLYSGPALRADDIKNADFQTLSREDLYWVGATPSVAWSAAPLAPAADAVFVEDFQISGGQTFEAENNAKLEGLYVRAEATGVIFATTGTATYNVNLPPGENYVVQVLASGTPKDGVYPQVRVSLDNQSVGTIQLSGREAKTYTLSFSAKPGAHTLKIEFTNDESSATEDRNLFVDKFTLGVRVGTPKVENLTNPGALVRYPQGKGALVLSSVKWDDAGGNGRRASRFASSLLGAMGAQFSPQISGSSV